MKDKEQMHLLELHCITEVKYAAFKRHYSKNATWFNQCGWCPFTLLKKSIKSHIQKWVSLCWNKANNKTNPPIKNKLFCTLNWIPFRQIFQLSNISSVNINPLSYQIGCFLQGTCRHSLANAHVYGRIRMQNECGEAGTTLRKHAPSRPQSMVSRQRQCCMAQL